MDYTIREDSSLDSLSQLPAEVEFRKKSIIVFLQSSTNQSLYASLTDDNYIKIATLTKHTFIATVISFENLYSKKQEDIDIIIAARSNQNKKEREGSREAERLAEDDEVKIDTFSKLIISCKNFEHVQNDDWNAALWGKEMIKFKNYQKIGPNLYQISYLSRGNVNTEEFMGTHHPQEYFVLLESNVNVVPIPLALQNNPLYFKIGTLASCIRLSA